MTDSSKLRRIKMCIEAAKRHHQNAIDTVTDAADGDIAPKDAFAATRRSLEASSGHLSSAHSQLLQLLRDRPDDGADDANEELSMSASSRQARLDDLDRRGGGVRNVVRAGPPAPAAIGGAAVTNHCQAKEVARLRSLWQ
jgi:hypothetical protein